MLIDSSQFPLVWIRINTPSSATNASPFDEFETLLIKKEPFILLNDEGLDKGDHENTPAEMKQTTRWMKKNKSKLKAYVKVAIYIEPNIAKRIASKAFAVVYEKFWGYPMLMVATKEEALSLANNFLSQHSDY